MQMSRGTKKRLPMGMCNGGSRNTVGYCGRIQKARLIEKNGAEDAIYKYVM